MRQQRGCDPALALKQARGEDRIGTVGNGSVEFLAQRRQADDQVGTAVDQRRNPLDAAAVGRKPLGDAVDHVLLLGRKLEPGLLQNIAQRGGGLRDLHRLGARVGDEVARRQPQFVHPPVDVLGEVADALQPLQLAKGLVDMADRDDARRPGDDDDGQHEQEAAEGELADRKRERPCLRRIRRRFGGHDDGDRLLRAAIYDVFRAPGNLPKTRVKPAFLAWLWRRAPQRPCPAGPSSRGRPNRPGQSAVMPASLRTLAHSATSALMISSNWASGALLASQPATSSFCRTSEVTSAASKTLPMRSTIGSGVPAGTTTPNHGVTCASAKPCSAMVGTSGKYLERPSLIAPMIRMAPVCTCASAWLADRKVELIRPLAMSGTICGVAAIADPGDVDVR